MISFSLLRTDIFFRQSVVHDNFADVPLFGWFFV